MSFVVEIAAPGVTVLCRRIAAREANPFMAPLSNRFDELDGTLWLDEVLIPWEHVFLIDPGPEAVARWLMWHHLYGWGARAEFSLGLALAIADAMGLKENDATIEHLIDLMAAVQTIRACQTAAVHEPEPTPTGFVGPNGRHVMAGGITLFKARQQISEILRIIPGSSLVVAPADTDLAAPELSAGLEEAFAGAGTPRRSARRCYSSPGTMCHRGSTAASWPSSCTPAAACRPGAAGCARALPITTRWPTRCCGRSTATCRRSTSARSRRHRSHRAAPSPRPRPSPSRAAG